MTLREFLNAILDYPIQFDLWVGWNFWAGVAITVVALFLLNLFFWYRD